MRRTTAVSHRPLVALVSAATAVLLSWGLAALPAGADPGHDPTGTDEGVLHALTSADHLAVLLALGAILAVVVTAAIASTRRSGSASPHTP